MAALIALLFSLFSPMAMHAASHDPSHAPSLHGVAIPNDTAGAAPIG